MYTETLPNGKIRYIQTYRDLLTGKNKKVYITVDKDTSRNRLAAAKLLQEKIEARLEASVPSAETLRLGHAIEMYLEYCSHINRPQTVKTARYMLGQVLKILDNIQLAKLTAGYITNRFISSDKKHTTVNLYIRRLHALIHWCYEQDLIDSTACIDKVKSLKVQPDYDSIENKYLERSEVTALLAAMSKNELYRFLTQFLILSGLRIGEAIALTLSDIDLTQRTITVNKTYVISSGKAGRTASPKTYKSNRTIFIQDELLKMLTAYKTWRLEYMFRNGINSELLFFGGDGGFISYQYYWRYLKRCTRKVTGKSLSPHALRHTHASLLFESGMPIEAISERLGHEDNRITKEIYTHITKKKKQEYNNALKTVNLL